MHVFGCMHIPISAHMHISRRCFGRKLLCCFRTFASIPWFIRMPLSIHHVSMWCTSMCRTRVIFFVATAYIEYYVLGATVMVPWHALHTSTRDTLRDITFSLRVAGRNISVDVVSCLEVETLPSFLGAHSAGCLLTREGGVDRWIDPSAWSSRYRKSVTVVSMPP